MRLFQKHTIVAFGAAIAVLATLAPALAETGYALSPSVVRSAPGPGYAKLGMVAPLQALTIDSCRPGWCYVTQANGIDGWVLSQKLAINTGGGGGARMNSTGRTNMVHTPNFDPSSPWAR